MDASSGWRPSGSDAVAASWGRKALRSRMGCLFCRLVLVLAAAAGGTAEHASAQSAYAADEVKAAFLYHFGSYVQWPDTGGEDTITIAVLGADSVREALSDFLPGRTIQGRPARVRGVRSIDNLGDAQILFIGEQDNGRLASLIDQIGDRPVLVVTDAPEGLDTGAVVNFQLVDRRVRFEISVPAAEAAGLMLSSRLLSAALRVKTTRWWADAPRGPWMARLLAAPPQPDDEEGAHPANERRRNST